MKSYTETNRELWNKLTEINSKSKFYDLEKFRSGASSLKKVELEELGNVQGKSLLHLQCHFGLDTLSWARQGAEVTGVDFSDEAIKLAQQLSYELDIPAEFVCSDMYELPNVLDKKFDIVFTSYGVLIWLSRLNEWADIVANYLKPGGTFYIVEFHPFINIFDEDWKKMNGSYFHNKNPVRVEQRGSYADPDADFAYTSYEWSHTMSDVINALRQGDIVVDVFHEFPYSSYDCFPGLEEKDTGEFTLKGHDGDLPLMYSIRATYLPQS